MPMAAGLRDYSNRQWAGLTKDYYYPRWEKWVNDAKAALTDGTAMPSTNWFLMEFEWANEKSDQGTAYATEASGGDLKALSQQVLDNYTIADLEELVETPSVQSENLALGKSVNASIATAEGSSTDLLTDGGKETLWQAAEHADSFTLSIDLEEEAQISGMEIDMQQIAGGFPYSYVVEAYSDGAWQIVAEDDSGEITSQTLIDWQGTASAVRFTFTSDDASIVPAVAELIVYGVQQEQKNYENVALGASVTTPTGETSLITDGDTGSLWVSNGDNYPAQIVLELDEEQYVDIMELYFEKPGLRYQYDVIIEDAQGNQTTVQDMSRQYPGSGWHVHDRDRCKCEESVCQPEGTRGRRRILSRMAGTGRDRAASGTGRSFHGRRCRFRKDFSGHQCQWHGRYRYLDQWQHI